MCRCENCARAIWRGRSQCGELYMRDWDGARWACIYGRRTEVACVEQGDVLRVGFYFGTVCVLNSVVLSIVMCS